METTDSSHNRAQKRLAVLQLAKALGNVSSACKRMGMDRTSFYEWKHRYERYGMEGLKDLHPVGRMHPQTTPEPVVRFILELSRAHPDWGTVRLSRFLKAQGRYVSSPTVRKILIRNGLGRLEQRLQKPPTPL